MLDALDRLDPRESTIVVFVSDHGCHLGAHGLWQKSDLFEGSTHVPMIIADPRRKTAGRSTKAMAELVVLYPNLADLCGLKAPDHVRGRSLVPVLDDPTGSVREGALSVTVRRGYQMHRELPRKTRSPWYSLRTPRYRYTEWNEGQFGPPNDSLRALPEKFLLPLRRV